MKNLNNVSIFLFSALVVLFAGCSSKQKQVASFRVGQFFLNSEIATVKFYEGTNETTSLQLNYGQLSEYQIIAPKTYTIKIWADNTLVLEKKLGIGTNGKYTLILTGIPEKNQPVNKESLSNTLHSIAEGAEGITDNNFLPQLIIQDDFYIKEKNKAHLSITNLLPGALPIAISFIEDQKEIQLDVTEYPLTSKLQVIEKGTYEVQLHLNGNPQNTVFGKATIENGTLYSFYVIPDPNKYVTHPKLIIGENRKSK